MPFAASYAGPGLGVSLTRLWRRARITHQFAVCLRGLCRSAYSL